MLAAVDKEAMWEVYITTAHSEEVMQEQGVVAVLVITAVFLNAMLNPAWTVQVSEAAAAGVTRRHRVHRVLMRLPTGYVENTATADGDVLIYFDLSE